MITAANFGTSAKAVAAAAFGSDEIADLWEKGTVAQWPQTGRSLVLNHTYKTALLKDPAFKAAYASGDTAALRKAEIKNAYGFEDIYAVPNLVNYFPAGEDLTGWINHKAAVLTATAPILPAPEVLRLLAKFDLIAEPKTGLATIYRTQGNAQLDQAQHLVEISYDAEIGVQSALQRLTSS